MATVELGGLIVMGMLCLLGLSIGFFIFKSEVENMVSHWKAIAEERGIAFHPISLFNIYRGNWGKLEGNIDGFEFQSGMERKHTQFANRNLNYYTTFTIALPNATDKRLILKTKKGFLPNILSPTTENSDALEQRYKVQTNDGDFAITVLDDSMKTRILDTTSQLQGNWTIDNNVLSYEAKMKLETLQARETWGRVIDTGIALAKVVEAYCSDKKT